MAACKKKKKCTYTAKLDAQFTTPDRSAVTDSSAKKKAKIINESLQVRVYKCQRELEDSINKRVACHESMNGRIRKQKRNKTGRKYLRRSHRLNGTGGSIRVTRR